MTNRELANKELGNHLSVGLSSFKPIPAQEQGIPEIQTNESSALSKGDNINNYNISVNVDGSGKESKIKNETKNIVQNIVSNYPTPPAELKKNLQENSNKFGNEINNNITSKNTNSILNNFLKNENSTNIFNQTTFQPNELRQNLETKILNNSDVYNFSNQYNNSRSEMTNLFTDSVLLNKQDSIKNNEQKFQRDKFLSESLKTINPLDENPQNSILFSENLQVQNQANLIKNNINSKNNFTNKNIENFNSENYSQQIFKNIENKTNIENVSNPDNRLSFVNQNNLNTDSLFNINSYNNINENNQNSFITENNRQVKLNSTNIQNNTENNLEITNTISREHSFKTQKTYSESARGIEKQHEFQAREQVLDGPDAMESLEMVENEVQDSDSFAETTPIAPDLKNNDFRHLNPTPSTIMGFVEVKNSPPIWRTVIS